MDVTGHDDARWDGDMGGRWERGERVYGRMRKGVVVVVAVDR